MRLMGQGRKRFVAAAVAMMCATGIGMAVGATSEPPSNAMHAGHGVNEFGFTKANLRGEKVEFKYTKGFFCDTTVPAKSSSGCEAGQKFNHKPPRARGTDPLFITVPLGFTVPRHSMQCPSGLVCVDHPGTMDLTRLEPALKPLYPQLTDAQLSAALENFETPGHQHFITTANGHHNQWWDVRVVGVTSKKVYERIGEHQSAAYLKKQVRAGKTTPIIRTNLFLFFGVK